MHRTNFAVVQNPEQRNMGCEETWRISNWAHALEGIITLEVPVRSCEISSAILKISSDRRTRFENDETVHTDVSAPLDVRSSVGRVRTKRNQLWFILLVRKGEYSGRTWWRHQMKKSALLAFCAGNSPVTGESPRADQRREALIFSLICAWTNSCANNRGACDLIRHRAHYDFTRMNLRSRPRLVNPQRLLSPG